MQGINNLGHSNLIGDIGTGNKAGLIGVKSSMIAGKAILATNSGDKPWVIARRSFQQLIQANPTQMLQGSRLQNTTLTPGIYRTNNLQLARSITFDAQGNPNARFIMQVMAGMTVERGTQIQVINGAKAHEIYFAIKGYASLEPGVSFKGNIICGTTLTLGKASVVDGSIMSLGGMVSLDSNRVIATDTFQFLEEVKPEKPSEEERDDIPIAKELPTSISTPEPMPSKFKQMTNKFFQSVKRKKKSPIVNEPLPSSHHPVARDSEAVKVSPAVSHLVSNEYLHRLRNECKNNPNCKKCRS